MKRCMALLLVLLLPLLLHACVRPLTPEESVKTVFQQANDVQKKRQPLLELPDVDAQTVEAAQAALLKTNEPQPLRTLEPLQKDQAWSVAAGTVDVLTASDGAFCIFVPGEYSLSDDYVIGQTYLIGDGGACLLSLARSVCGRSLTGQIKVVFNNDDGDMRYVLFE